MRIMNQTIRLFRRGVPPDSRFCCDGRCERESCPQFPPAPESSKHTPAAAALAIALIAGGSLLLIGVGHGEPTAIALGAAR